MSSKQQKKTWQPNFLFRNGPNPHLNACVGENGGPYDLAHYAHGFFVGGDVVVDAAAKGQVPVDAVIYPAAFSYRHGIELYTKHLIYCCNSHLNAGIKLQKTHDLMKLWNTFSKESGKHVCMFNPSEVSIAGDIVEEFNEIDPSGEVFRYPEDLKGNKHLTGLKLINVDVLKEGMGVIHELLRTWQYQFEH